MSLFCSPNSEYFVSNLRDLEKRFLLRISYCTSSMTCFIGNKTRSHKPHYGFLNMCIIRIASACTQVESEVIVAVQNDIVVCSYVYANCSEEKQEIKDDDVLIMP